MSLLHPQLAAFAAVIHEASFEGAARQLSVTPSAISQRVKALEDRLGQVLIVRQPPCRPTPAGEKLLVKVKPMLALEAEAFEEFDLAPSSGSSFRQLSIAVNDDSLATWVIPALAQLHDEFGYYFDVMVDDQDHSLEKLRDGSAIGAVTSESKAIQGCDIQLLGVMKYHAVASPLFVERYFTDELNAATLSNAPMLVYSRKDELQSRYLQQVTGEVLTPPCHYLPTSIGFIDAAALGLGWCMVPESMIADRRNEQKIQVLTPDITVDVPLYWQHPAVRSTTMMNVTRAFLDIAGKQLSKMYV